MDVWNLSVDGQQEVENNNNQGRGDRRGGGLLGTEGAFGLEARFGWGIAFDDFLRCSFPPSFFFFFFTSSFL